MNYSCPENESDVIQGKVALCRKGLFFCREQLKKAYLSFLKILRGDNVSITDEFALDGDASDNSEDGDLDSSESDDDGEADDFSAPVTDQEITVPIRPFDTNNVTWIWELPHGISQSTYQNRNGSNACSIIALLIAQGIYQVDVDIDPSAVLLADWLTLICGCIRVGNAMYDRCRANLPHRYLSVAEAAMVAGDRLDVSVGQPLPVRVSDSHHASTIGYHLVELCKAPGVGLALLIVNEKTVLFVSMKGEKLVLVDSHLHEPNGAIVILGKPCNVDNFIHAVQESLGLDNNTFGNLVHVTF